MYRVSTVNNKSSSLSVKGFYRYKFYAAHGWVKKSVIEGINSLPMNLFLLGKTYANRSQPSSELPAIQGQRKVVITGQADP